MKELKNLKERICNFENLIGAYRDASKGKRYRSEVLSFGFNLSENLHDIQKDLLEMTYKVGPYREFYVRYPKPRLVMALGFRDRVVQWAIYRQINPYLDKRYITHSYGCRQGKGTLPAAICLQNWQMLVSRKETAEDWYLIKGDISKYFYRVDHEKVIDSYKEVSDDEWFHWLISTIINNPDVPFGLPPGVKPDDCPRSKRMFEVGMPIGNLTSQETANLFLNKLDCFCKHKLHIHFYVRYMDDFCIIVKGKANAKEIYKKIERFLREKSKLDISPKSRIQKAIAPVEFVGYLLTPDGIRMRKKTTRHIKSSLRHIMKDFYEWNITYEEAMNSVICYIGMCKHCKGHNMLRWIEDNFILTRSEMRKDQIQEPPKGRNFYAIHNNEDGTADIYLRPEIVPLEAEDQTDYDIVVMVMKDVEMWEGLEQDIRERYDDYCHSADKIYL